MASLQAAVDRAIRSRLRKTSAVRVRRDESGDLCTMHDAQPEEAVIAYTAPVTSQWTSSPNKRTGAKREMADWSWEARVEFRRPVDVSLYQEALATDDLVPEDKSDPANVVAPFILELQQVNHEDPPHSEQETGTVLTIAYNVKVQRR